MGAAESASRPVSEQPQTPSSPSSPHPYPSSPQATSPHASSPYASSPYASSTPTASPHAASPHALSPHAALPHPRPLPAADPSSSPPLRRIPTDHPLRNLLDAKIAPPTDPESDFYLTLFTDFQPIAQTWATDKQGPLTTLVTQALATPTSGYATALSNSIRAATYHLRLEAEGTLLGALYFSHAVLTDLHRLARSPLEAYLALAATPAELHLRPADRIDLALSLRTQLLHATLQQIARRVGKTTPAPQFATVAIPLLLLLLSHEADMEPQSRRNDGDGTPRTSRIHFAAFANAPDVIVSLLDVIVSAADYTSPLSQLPYARDGRTPSSLFAKTGGRNAVSVWDAWDTFATSAPAVHLRNGFADVVSALATVSQRLKVTPWVADTNSGGNGHGGGDSMLPPHDMFTESVSRTAASASDTSVGSSLPMRPENAAFQNGRSDDGTPIYRIADGDAQRTPLHVNTSSAHGDSATSRHVALAEEALVLLNLLCRPDEGRPDDNAFTHALCNLRDGSGDTERSEEALDGDNDRSFYPFSSLYEALGRWLADARAAPVAYLLLVRNRSFRTFALARTDPDVIVAPLLASLRARCGVGGVPADGCVVAAVLLALTVDKGFCEAIDSIVVPDAWSNFIVDGVRLGGDRLVLSGAVLVVCARVVQQSLVVRRERADVFLAGVCLAAMANIGKDATGLHAFVAERVVCLVEFLGRRRKRAVAFVKHVGKVPVEPPRVGDGGVAGLERGLNADGGEVGTGEGAAAMRRNMALVERLSEFIGMSLEVIVGILRARSTVAANRHLVYALMHREGVLEGEHIGRCSVKARALVHVIGRMVHFFGEFVDRRDDGGGHAGGDGSGARGRGHGRVVAVRREGSGSSRGGVGISVERVFEVIEENARVLPADIFEGVPVCSFSYREGRGTDRFLRLYADSLLFRFWRRDAGGGEKRLGVFAGESPGVRNCFMPAR